MNDAAWHRLYEGLGIKDKCPHCGQPTVTKGQYCSVKCAEEASKANSAG